MSAAPVAHYLAEFGQGRASSPLLRRAPAPAVLLRSPAEEMAERLAEATARGREEGRAAASAEGEAALAAERSRSQDALTVARAAWASDEGARLGALITEGLKEIEERVSRSAAAILTPILEQGRHRVVVAALAEALSALLGRGAAPLVRIEGPADLLAALRDRVGDGASHVAFRECDQADVVIRHDDTLIESQLQAWAELLGEAQDG